MKPINLFNYNRKFRAEDIFEMRTNVASYDAMLGFGKIAGGMSPTDYFRNEKGINAEIVWMTPEKYFIESARIHRSSIEREFAHINPQNVKEYKNRVLLGSKMSLPVLDYDIKNQEGRHRVAVARELGVRRIPVMIIKRIR